MFKPPQQRSSKGTFEQLDTAKMWSNFSMLIYGPPGIGKTWLAGSSTQVPEMCPVLLIDNDGGSKTLQRKTEFEGIDIFRVHSFEAYNKIFEVVSTLKDDEGKGELPYHTVIIDNLGELHYLAMELELSTRPGTGKSQDLVPTQKDYYVVRAMLHKLIKHFAALPLNLILTAHATKDKDELSGLFVIEPAVPGKLAFEIPGLVDIVLYLSRERAKTGASSSRTQLMNRIAYCQPQGKTLAKDSSDTLGETMVDATMQKIISLLGARMAA